MKVNLEKIKPLVGEWYPLLEPFFKSEECEKIYDVLIQSREQIVPLGKDMWNFLKFSNPNNIKVIIIGLDAYPGQYQRGVFHATGIPFDCSNSPDGKLQPSLISFWEGLEVDLGQDLEKEIDLKFLLEQGVFLGNYGVTCKLMKTGSMLNVWKPFWKYMFNIFNEKYLDVPIVFLGKEAAKLKEFCTFQRIFELEHPSFAARNNEIWNTKGTFSAINKLLIELNGEGIDYVNNTIPF